MIDEMKGEEMFAFIAPDGAIQTATIAHEIEMCYAITKLLAKAGYGFPPEELLQKGFVIAPIAVTILLRQPN